MTENKGLPAIKFQILLALSEAGGASDMVTAPSVVKAGLRLGFDLNNTTAYRQLTAMSEFVQFRTINRVRKFRLKAEGRAIVAEADGEISNFIRPGTPWSSMKQLKKFLAENCKDELLLIDPYISEETLDLLSDVTVPMSVLTVNAGRKGKEASFQREFQKFRKEKHGAVDIRITSSKDLHGRYIFFGDSGYVLDHSVQDWGTKPALIMPLYLKGVYEQIHSHFDQIFKMATPLI